MKSNCMLRIIALLMGIVLVFPAVLGVYAVENCDSTGTSKDTISLWGHTYLASEVTKREIYDVNNNLYYLYEVGNEAYFIYDPVTKSFLEGSPCAPSPYIGKTGELVYIGPMNYFIQENGSFHHTIVDTSYTVLSTEILSLQDAFSDKLATVQHMTAEKQEASTSTARGLYNNMIVDDRSDEGGGINYYIKGYSYIKNATYPQNEGDTCGYVAATLILYYWHKMKGGIIPPSYLNANGTLKTNGSTQSDNLQKKLLSFGDGGGSWGLEIRDVLIEYCEWRNIPATSTYYVTGIGYRDELQNNRPAILFGILPNVSGGLPVLHAVTAYGFHYGNETADASTIVHYGWSGYSEVYLNSGLIGSVTLFNPQ